jgi:hypothetical protein
VTLASHFPTECRVLSSDARARVVLSVLALRPHQTRGGMASAARALAIRCSGLTFQCTICCGRCQCLDDRCALHLDGFSAYEVESIDHGQSSMLSASVCTHRSVRAALHLSMH